MWTSNKNMVCLPASCYLFNKFWPIRERVKIIGYDRPDFSLPDNFEFISLGVQRGPKFWSDDMRSFYSEQENDYFYSIWEDAFIVDNVDLKFLNLIQKLIENDKNFFKFNLTADVSTRPHCIVKNFDSFDLIMADQYSRYRFSTQHCVWNRKHFLDKLEPNQSPWDFELNDKKAFNDGLNIYATKRNYAVYMGHLYKSGKKRELWHNCVYGANGNRTHQKAGLNIKDIRFLEESGWIPEI